MSQDQELNQQPQKPLWRSKWLWGIVGITLIMCCMCSGLYILFGPEGKIAEPTTTLSPTIKPTSTSKPTITFSPSPSPSSTATPTLTPTSSPTPTPFPIITGTVSSQNVNIRSGPGMEYPIVEAIEQGTTVAIYAKAGDWYQLTPTGERWIAQYLVRLSDGAEIPESDNIPPTPTHTPTSTNTPTATPTPTPNATATARAIADAQATATIEAYVQTPPQGTWCNQNNQRGVCVGDFRYVNAIAYTRAPSNGRFIAFGVAVKNIRDSGDLHVNPTDVTLVMEDGRTYAYASETFSYWSTPLPGVDIAPGNVAEGGIVFLIPNDVAPRYVYYEGGIFESEVVIDLFEPPEDQEP